MTEFERNTGLTESEKGQFETFRRELAPYFQQLESIGLKVLIWGPGEGTTYYFKRTEIRTTLAQSNRNDEVVTSEDLFREIEHPTGVDKVQLEMLHANVADVVFGLVTSDPRQSGIYMEIDNLLRYESMVNKTWLIIPDTRDWKKVGAFVQEPLLKSFPDYRMKAFRIKDLETCERVRQFCLDKISAERSRKMRKRIQEQLGNSRQSDSLN